MSTIPSNFLFRFQIPCRRVASSVKRVTPETLDASYSLPFWSRFQERRDTFGRREPSDAIARNSSNSSIFDFRLGWSPLGIFITTVVSGKQKQEIWSQNDQQRADAVRVCLDTRDVKELRRATKFCHKFIFYPTIGAARGSLRPLVELSPINRAKDYPEPIDVKDLKVAAACKNDGYAFSCFLPAQSLTGFDPEEFDRFGLHYVVKDSQYGAFVLQHGDPLPMEDDPSLWDSFVMEN